MRKSLKKSLIYLIMTMLIMPTWLVTGMLNAKHVKAAGADPASVVINELMWSGSSLSTADEWIELRNMTSMPIDISNWVLQNASSGGDLVVPAGNTIPADGYFLIANWDKSASVLNITADWITTLVSLDNTDKQYVLSDDVGNVIDVADDGTGNPLAGIGGTIKRSMGRNTIPGDGRFAENWHSSIGKINLDIGVTDFATPGFENDNIRPIDGVVHDGLAMDINSTNSLNTLSANWSGFYDKNLDHYRIAIGTTIGGFDIYPWTDNSGTSVTVSSLTLTEGTKYYFSVKAIDAVGLESDIVSSDGVTIDTQAPIITPNGNLDVTVYIGSTYNDPGATAFDNFDVDISSKIVTVSNVNTSVIGDYTVTYNVSDSAGNAADQVTRTVHVVNRVLSDPTVTASISGKTITATWNKVDGATGYYVYLKNKINGSVLSTDPKADIPDANTISYSNNVAEYGSYYLVVVAYDSFGNLSAFPEVENQTIVKVSAPVPVATVEEAPVTTSIAPTSAKAATTTTPSATTTTPSATTPAVTNENTNGDDGGVIKGDETSTDDEEKINWTPWIVLFVLIILAGAATGGYFYWFAGEDEVKSVVREPKKTESERVVTSLKSKQNGNRTNKKSKRW